jgi:hypothetical protein
LRYFYSESVFGLGLSSFTLMAPAKDRNVVSMWFFFFVPLLEMLPCIGTIFMLVWAFSGENRSRQNYCRARLLIWLLVIVFWGVIISAGVFQDVMKAAGYQKVPEAQAHKPSRSAPKTDD